MSDINFIQYFNYKPLFDQVIPSITFWSALSPNQLQKTPKTKKSPLVTSRDGKTPSSEENLIFQFPDSSPSDNQVAMETMFGGVPVRPVAALALGQPIPWEVPSQNQS